MKGLEFSEAMPTGRADLDNEQAAQVLNFLRQTRSNQAVFPNGTGASMRSESVGRADIPWSVRDLDAATSSSKNQD